MRDDFRCVPIVVVEGPRRSSATGQNRRKFLTDLIFGLRRSGQEPVCQNLHLNTLIKFGQNTAYFLTGTQLFCFFIREKNGRISTGGKAPFPLTSSLIILVTTTVN